MPSTDIHLDWGTSGAEACLTGVRQEGRRGCAVVVDILSFTTSVTVGVASGLEVFPYRWARADAADFARRHDAHLALGRRQAEGVPGASGNPTAGVPAVSLSPVSIARAGLSGRLVLPSPNGSTISALLAEGGADVIAASLRNRAAVAGHLAKLLTEDPALAVVVIAAGERWPDGSLRVAQEDLWGAGAVLSALREQQPTGRWSPEARAAARAYDAVAPELAHELDQTVSGIELIEMGFAADVAMAAALDVSATVPVLTEGCFREAGHP
ncbi:MAG: 2-phosphosulfolactate phosphatase [Nocardioides sp.]